MLIKHDTELASERVVRTLLRANLSTISETERTATKRGTLSRSHTKNRDYLKNEVSMVKKGKNLT